MTHETEFTKAPWTDDRMTFEEWSKSIRPDTLMFVFGGGNWGQFAGCCPGNGYQAREGEANARLMTASPDMYVALSAAWGLNNIGLGLTYSEKREMAYDALAKVRWRGGMAPRPLSLSLDEQPSSPRVVDNDRGNIKVVIDGEEIRGWTYHNHAEQRLKMLCAREFTEGWFQAEKNNRR